MQYNIPTMKQITRSFTIVLSLALTLLSLPPSALANGMTAAGKTGFPRPIVFVPVGLNSSGVAEDVSTMPREIIAAPNTAMEISVLPDVQTAPIYKEEAVAVETMGEQVRADVLPVGAKMATVQPKHSPIIVAQTQKALDAKKIESMFDGSQYGRENGAGVAAAETQGAGNTLPLDPKRKDAILARYNALMDKGAIEKKRIVAIPETHYYKIDVTPEIKSSSFGHTITILVPAGWATNGNFDPNISTEFYVEFGPSTNNPRGGLFGPFTFRVRPKRA